MTIFSGFSWRMCSFSFEGECFSPKRVIFSPGLGLFDFWWNNRVENVPFVFCIYPTNCVPPAGPDCWPKQRKSSGAARPLVPFSPKARSSECDDISRISEPAPAASAPHHWLLSPHSKGDQEQLSITNSPCVSRRNFYLGFVSPAWTAKGQTDIHASTAVAMKEGREMSYHFSITNAQRKKPLKWSLALSVWLKRSMWRSICRIWLFFIQ